MSENKHFVQNRGFSKNKHSHIRNIASIIFLKITKSLGEMHSRAAS